MFAAILDYFRSTSPVELVAVALALAYLLLAIAASAWCWPLAFASSAIYICVFTGAHLYMDAALNLFFAAMAGYGWYQWRHGGRGRGELPIARAPLRVHLAAIVVIAALTLVFGQLLGRYTNQAWPHVDSFIAWASVVTTWLAARKYIDNWPYWIAIDAVAMPVYLNRGLRVTALLFGLYVLLAFAGWLSWQRLRQRQEVLA
ncbi:MAG TPA: nicotinamide riboside transporter PnuC [Steroidobacteraceae bacterium]|nr:nicotinamide riboside transporter PnuC [Steroidobacteraceae bacterium]